MKELTPFKKKGGRLQNSLCCSIKHFRKGNDSLGLDSFLNSMDDLEDLLELQQYTGDLRMKIHDIAPMLQALYKSMKNQDLVGMIDVLEFTFYPLTKEWIEECDK
ncbi:hypothetical protein [Desulfitibacter alkalitolerans]|uniref:hypothetical protein n=1 Tax=Desulfitibacter alkalitolerans TaxID=264641 RepID=UPI0004817422|nr:hypothetical protein [Desulfitibacter alkalitolerans]